MAAKRYAEYCHIADPEQAGRYRMSFVYYNEKSLLLSAFFYALMSAFLVGVFLIKYRIEYLFSIPFMAGLFVFYLFLAMEKNSVVQVPEKLYKEKRFMLYVLFLIVLTVFLSFYEAPWLEILLRPIHLNVA